MADTSNSAMLEVVRLTNGRFSVLPVGTPALPEDTGEFDTQAEAEAWMFERMQEMDAHVNDLDVINPGGGQGLR